MRIEVIGVEPPCKKCTKLLDNAKEALNEVGLQIEVVKLNALSDEVVERYGIVMTPALVIDGFIVSEGKVLRKEQIARIIKDMVK
ncbi:MAG: thioredoxin family protein [Armatimonadetes bacterium]|nr:thioredoxin family protein [Armatimonadota bacterium]